MPPIDYNRYPPNWKTEIRPAVLKRADNRCEFCGRKNRQIVYSVRIKNRNEWFNEVVSYPNVHPVRVVLTIAHMDHDETNHGVNLDRLAALCQLCHIRYDAKEKYRRSIEKWKK